MPDLFWGKNSRLNACVDNELLDKLKNGERIEFANLGPISKIFILQYVFSLILELASEKLDLENAINFYEFLLNLKESDNDNDNDNSFNLLEGFKLSDLRPPYLYHIKQKYSDKMIPFVARVVGFNLSRLEIPHLPFAVVSLNFKSSLEITTMTSREVDPNFAFEGPDFIILISGKKTDEGYKAFLYKKDSSNNNYKFTKVNEGYLYLTEALYLCYDNELISKLNSDIQDSLTIDSIKTLLRRIFDEDNNTRIPNALLLHRAITLRFPPFMKILEEARDELPVESHGWEPKPPSHLFEKFIIPIIIALVFYIFFYFSSREEVPSLQEPPTNTQTQ